MTQFRRMAITRRRRTSATLGALTSGRRRDIGARTGDPAAPNGARGRPAPDH